MFERLWAAWYAYIRNDVLATGIMSFVMHEIVYFGRSLPWAIIDRIHYFNKYKIQNVNIASCSYRACDIDQEADIVVAKNSNSSRAVELRQAGLALPFYR